MEATFGIKEAEELTRLLVLAVETNNSLRMEMAFEEARRELEFSLQSGSRSERQAKRRMFYAFKNFSNRIGVIGEQRVKEAKQFNEQV